MLLEADVHAYLFLSFSLLAVGVYGLLSRKSVIRMLFAVEMIINAANLNFVIFSAQRNLDGEVFTFFTIGLAALEAAVGLAIVIVFYKRFGEVIPSKIKNLRW
ncbi:NADH-quinone oxidoreductase subunit NuoK [Thermovibrio ammonificans]|jgi:NADH-quinone oxidoreductase subunit K|uniref:NADH-quinone oxidoreductase subunit K n=1 Tax=Thermovibrio ammonificans (strain DSM 15698 / JCM 12110 / HB-1) TaxID=648996 RepID=E8T4J4_THEA1|nr:NADH-quinone oxidoreductase subunit NuoK [Thermovibrio ammonificans]ADU97452.1 NADH-ubiquinone oxidoreductase chain 4L [Thermovibrio ammonificans HB-1]